MIHADRQGGQPYERARDFFEDARLAVRDQASAQDLLERIEAEASSGSALGAHVKSSPRADALDAMVARRVDRSEAVRARIEANAALIDAAGVILWGAGWLGFAGVASVLGADHAAVMDHYYLCRRTWGEVAALVGWSGSKCRQMRDQALGVVDDYGIGRILEGTGIAMRER